MPDWQLLKTTPSNLLTVKKIANIVCAFLVETLGLPGLIQSAYKVLAYQMKFGSRFLKTVVVTVFTDPIIFLLTSGILLWMYLDEMLSEIQKYQP